VAGGVGQAGKHFLLSKRKSLRQTPLSPKKKEVYLVLGSENQRRGNNTLTSRSRWHHGTEHVRGRALIVGKDTKATQG
jgi:hypothetical protein